MKQFLLEIVRQKQRLISFIIILLLLDATLWAVIAYQLPSLADLQAKWSSMRSQVARAGKFDTAALHQQGSADLEKLMLRIPLKREFARVLGDLLESAASSAVEVGTINYKPVQIKGEPLLSYQLSYSASGGYAAVKSYLSDLQKNPELIVIDSVTFSNSSLFVENVTMALRITIYLREGA